MHGFGGMLPGVWMGMGVFWLLLIGVIVWLVVQLASPRRHDVPPPAGLPWVPPAGPTGESPLDLLDRRLAAGEIDVATHEQVREALLRSRGGQP